MYDYTTTPFSLERNGAVRLDNLLAEAMSVIRDVAGFDLHIIKDQNHLKHRLYCLLNKYTSTPREIESLIEQSEASIQSIVDKIKNDKDDEVNKRRRRSGILRLCLHNVRNAEPQQII